MIWRTCPACGAELMPGEVCAPCAAPRVPDLLAWDRAIRTDFASAPVGPVGQVQIDREKFPELIWDLTWLSGQDPWENARGEGAEGVAQVAFFGRLEGRPFVLHDVRDNGPILYVVGHRGLSGQGVFDAVFAALARKPWYGHREPALLM